jgi:hypothetical protein
VPASANGDLQLVGACEVERGGDVGSAHASRDHGRPAVDVGVEAAAGRVVVGVVGRKHAPGERAPQFFEVVCHSNQ